MNTNFKLIPLLLAVVVSIAASGCSKEAKKAGHLKRAEAHFQAGDYDRAEIEFLNVLRFERSNQVALRHLGLMAFEQGRLLRAFALLSDARQANPEDFEVRLKLATMTLAAGQGEEAREEVLMLLARQPTNEAALLLLVDSSVDTNLVQDTEQRLARLRPEIGASVGYHLAQGALHLRRRDLEAAEGSLREALARDPKSSVAHAFLGNLALVRNDPSNALVAFQAAAEDTPWRSPYRVRLADLYAATGDTHAARALLETIKKQTPDYLPAMMRLAQLDFAERRFEDCDATLNLVLLRESAHLEALLLRARMYLARNEAGKAVRELERAVKAYPRMAQVHHQMAVARLAQNDMPGAIQSLNEALALSPDLPEATMMLAELNLRRGNAAAAVASLTRLVGQRPDLMPARLLLAMAHRAANQPDAALAIYDQISRQFPTNPQPPFLRGLVLGQQGKTQEARRSFEQALTFAPDFMAALEQLVNLDLAERRFAEAEQRAQRELQRTPTNAAPYLLVARVQLAQTNLDAAERTLLQARELAPQSPAVNSLLARVYVQGNKQSAALKQLQEVVARNTNDFMAWMQIAELHGAAGNHTAARDTYESLLQINPRFGPALNNLAYLYSEKLGELKRAYELAARARELMPNDPSTADTFGWILYRQKDYPRALTLIQECARAMPEQPEVQYHLGMTHYMMGEETAARLALRNAVQLGEADATWRAEAAERLRILELDVSSADAAVVRDLEQLAQRLADDPILQVKLAAVAETKQDWQRARGHYEKALQVNTNLVPVMVKLAGLYAAQLQNPERAFALARRARSLEPTDARIAHTLGRLALDAARSAADFQWAYGLLQESSRALPIAEVHLDFARAAYALGQVEVAQAALQRVPSLSPSAAEAESAREFGEWIALPNQPQQLEAAAARVASQLQQKPDFVPALLANARLLEQQRNYVGAREAYERALKIYPLLTPAHKPLALLLNNHLNEAARAYDHASQARAAFPNDPEIARLLGQLSYQRGEFSRAAQLLQESARAFPDDGEQFYYLGMAQFRTKQSESRASLTKALALAPNSALAPEARKVLDELK